MSNRQLGLAPRRGSSVKAALIAAAVAGIGAVATGAVVGILALLGQL